MITRPSLRPAAIDNRQSTVGEQQRTSAELADSATDSGSCFEHCSPIRSGCPGPAAQMSTLEARWVPICRRVTR